MSGVFNTIWRVLAGMGGMIMTLAGALLIGFGVPLGWIYIASQLYAKPGAVTGSVAVFLGTGIIVTYWAILVLASWVRAKLGLGITTIDARPKRQSWNRSMRDESYKPGISDSDPVELLFVATAVISMVGFVIWFALFAGAPFPSNT